MRCCTFLSLTAMLLCMVGFGATTNTLAQYFIKKDEKNELSAAIITALTGAPRGATLQEKFDIVTYVAATSMKQFDSCKTVTTPWSTSWNNECFPKEVHAILRMTAVSVDVVGTPAKWIDQTWSDYLAKNGDPYKAGFGWFVFLGMTILFGRIAVKQYVETAKAAKAAKAATELDKIRLEALV